MLMMEQIDIQKYIEQLYQLIIAFAPKLVMAVVLLVLGFFIINRLVRSGKKVLISKNFDTSLVSFLSSLVSILLKAVLLVSIAGIIGVETASFVAIIGAAGLAIGLALQGSLSNFAAGIMILIFKPFKVGDVIEAQDEIAAVSSISIFHTVLKTYDNKTIIIPNGPLYNNKIINYSTASTRRVEWVFGISYTDDIDKAKEVIRQQVHTDERVLDKDQPFIKVAELGDSSVNIKVRAEVKPEDYWDMFFEKTELVKKAFDKEGISIPFPQVDAHIYNS